MAYIMEKKLKPKKITTYNGEVKATKAEEPEVIYNRTVKIIPLLKNFTYSEFKKIADKTPFTQAEWASILHVSERTLQRYAKNNGSFAPINAERALEIAQVINEGKKTFGKTELFYNWLKRKPLMLEGPLSLDSLTTAYGIKMVLTQLGRIQHGILA
jgi:putative toxin-antitoxin system antitoxin component (TIGR02293 family)